MNKYAIIDVETTGGTPAASKITEIAIFIYDGNTIIDEFVSLVNPESEIPQFVVQLTGITQKMVEKAPVFEDIASKIIEITSDCVFVAHNVQFDYGMIRREFKHLGIDYRLPHLCTVTSSRHIIPDLESYSLGKLTQSLGIVVNGRHRAGGDALATVELFSLLLGKNPQKLESFIQDELNPRELHPKLDMDFVDELPSVAGIYSFFDETNQLIFMGKTANIKKRVAQHLRNKSSKKGAEMRQEIARIEIELTGSELIARLLLLRKLTSVRPKFNVSSKKGNFPYGIFIEKSGLFPHLIVAEIAKRNDIPCCSFSKIKEATTVLAKLNDKFQLNNEFNQANLDQAIESLTYPEKKIFIIEKGRERKEKSIILIEEGTFSGYAYLHFTEMKKNNAYWLSKINYFSEHVDDYSAVQEYLRENESLPIKVIK